ncbi:MAG: hypothetical protein RJQ07_11915 [Pseudomonadales bacterium]
MNKREAQELLPWFVAGSLSAEENRAVQAFIDSGEIKQGELEEFALFAEAVNEQTIDEPEFRPELLSEVMSQLDSVEQEQADPAVVVQESGQRAAQSEGLWQKIQSAFADFEWSLTPPLAKVAMAGQFALVIALGALLLMQPDAQQDVSYGTVSSTSSVAQADLTLAVSASATEAQLRALLIDLDAQIVGGPDSLGMYKIDLPESADLAATLAALQANALVTFAQPVAK